MAGNGSSVKLLGLWPSPYVNRVQISLKLKSIDYEFIEEPFGPKSDLLLKSNPVHKKIPVFFHDDKPISESLIIVQYIDEQWTSGHSILPSDPLDRATARFWAAYADDEWFPALKNILMASEEERLGLVVKMKDGLAFLEETFIKSSKGQKFFGGEDISFLDIAFGSFLGWLKAVEKLTEVSFLDESSVPHLVVWADNFLSHEAVKGIIPEPDALVEVAKMIKAMVESQAKN
ncbi:glutathione S-transferase U17-like [Impatiens glandulifera]|uniref:glutathione S-transferase U17-like n=1 Tax=Impatiens glandulifera TaxID=253017 RepID=UPI001FB13F48|nr:glutathione S-transferase U17-like [Impatiens glandulifera]